MPSLNVREYIGQCIESVMNQTLEEIEVICVDAGSTDGTLELLHSYQKKDERIKVITSPQKSYGYQMNLGLDMARGEYIGIVETDDYISPLMYENLFKIATYQNVDFVKSGYIEVLNEGNKEWTIEVKRNISSMKSGKVLMLNDNKQDGLIDLMHIWSGLYKREFIEENKIHFNETPGASFQDVSFSILTGLLAKKCIYIHDAYYFYRIDNENSSVKSDKKYNCVIDEYRYIQKELEKRNLFTEENQKLVFESKLETYEWNYLRLSQKSADIFFNEIQDELSQEVLNNKYDFKLDSIQMNRLKLLTDKKQICIRRTDEDKKKKVLDRIFDIVEKGKKFVIVGDGQYGQYLLFLQKIIDVNCVLGICDNSSEKQGKIHDGYEILPINLAVEKYSDAYFVIANKYHYEELQEQLVNIGVLSDKIIKYNITIKPQEWLKEKNIRMLSV